MRAASEAGPGSPLAARPSATGTERITALDGYRALGLVLVMAFHFGVGWLQGGFFGVDLFYVLSGYLITGLLVGEYRRRSRIGLGAFWLRRARRLLPALLIVLVVVTLMVRFAEPAGLYPGYRTDALSALFYFSNWWQIAASSNYFVVTGAVSPLTHTWSLAVEEQFYLVWPLVVLAVMGLSRSFVRGVRALLVLSVLGALLSALEMALLYGPSANVTRLYFGTDTHAQSILVGAALACAMTLLKWRRGGEGMDPHVHSARGRLVLSALGVAGLAVALVLSYALSGFSAFTYRGGFLVVDLSAAALIVAAVAVPGGPVARVLALRPLVWLGTVSYGAYLWHYPVFVYLDAYRTGQSGLSLLAIRFAVTLALAAASFYLVERPVMYGTFWRSLKAAAPAAVLMGATVAMVIAATVVSAAPAVRVRHYREVSLLTRPPKVVVLGDSMAMTLGTAIAATAPPGVTVVQGGLFGCGLAIASYTSNAPPQQQLPMFPPCNAASPPAQQWPAVDRQTVAGTAPGDVVLFIAGAWEVQDLLVNGKWTNITQPSFQRYELQQMRTAVAIGTAHGAHFDFATLPALDTGLETHDTSLSVNSPERRLTYDRLITEVAHEFPGRASVVGLAQILSPHGVFSEYRGGVQIRTIDGEHTPSYDPHNPYASNSTEPVAEDFYNWLGPRIWPLILATSSRPR